MSPISR